MPLDQPLSAVLDRPTDPEASELEWIDELNDDTRRQLAAMLGEYLLYEKHKDYRPYPKQALFHAAGSAYLNRLLRASNQSGKTWCASFEVGYHLTGEYPPWWRGKRFDHPILCWVSGETAESVRDLGQFMLFGPQHALGTGTIPKRCLTPLIKYSKAVPGLIDFARVKHKAGGTSLVRFRTYEQKRTAWQGPSVHVLWWDEEPPADKYAEGLARTIATGGITLMTYTPIKGRTEVTRKYIEVKGRPSSYSDTVMTIHDAHHMTPEKIAIEKERWPEHEWGARLFGEPMAGEGQIYPVLESDITCKPFEIPDWWPQIAGIDFGWTHPAAAVTLAWDRESDIVYVTREWRQAKRTIADNVQTLKHWGKHLKWAWPMDGHRVYDRDSGAGYAKTYRDEGLAMMMTHSQYPEIAAEKGTKRARISVERGIQDILDRMKSQRLKAFNTLHQWHSERRLYHRVGGKIHEEEDDLMDATRVAIMSLRYAAPPRPPPKRSRRRPPNWRAS